VFLNETDLSRYVEFKYMARKANWDDPMNIFSYKFYNAKQCELKDFGEGPEVKLIYDAWPGFSLLCPDISDKDNIMFEGVDAFSKYS
jgi:hypothetical protein